MLGAIERTMLAKLLLLVPPGQLESPSEPTVAYDLILAIFKGEYATVLDHSALAAAKSQDTWAITQQYPQNGLLEVLHALVGSWTQQLAPEACQLLAVTLLQTFIQFNFTGPQSELSAYKIWFNEADSAQINKDAVRLLAIEGKMAYDYINEPLNLVLALLLFERLQGVQCSLVSLTTKDTLIEDIVQDISVAVESVNEDSSWMASLLWWRARALQVHLAMLSEPSDILGSASSLLLQQQLVNLIAPAGQTDLELLQYLQLSFFLESARTGVHAQTEHLSEPFLHKAAEISGLQLVLTGAKAKRTKFQTFYTASLILLAKSKASNLMTDSQAQSSLEVLELNSDLLLEKPVYESLDDLVVGDDHSSKKIKLDDIPYFAPEKKRLLPISERSDDIPSELKELDPNNQPALSDIDTVQLLLRLVVLKQTTASGNIMVEEEMAAIVNRIIYSVAGERNWAIFGRTLWERSLLETNKSRTVERGILQMTALVEETGINVKTRLIPEAKNDQGSEFLQTASRLRFIHLLPLMPHWAMDSKLAEKYMSLGVLKSAIDIYERLNMVTEAALCYAAVDNEPQAQRMLEERIRTHPEDARAMSILGDIRQDPELWLKAWEVGRYAKAKASLSKYYHSPPMSSGVERDLGAAIGHMQDALKASPLSYENWFFYGCCGLESHSFELAAEAFTRCVALDDTNSHAWSNLASALLKLDKTPQAFTALKRALQQGEGAKRSWRIFENYVIVAAKLGEWNDVLYATRELIKIHKESRSGVAVDIPILEKLVQILVEEPYQEEARLTHFQKSCIDLVCVMVPLVINESARVWRLISRVELWRGRPWAALDCAEKAYRSTSLRPEMNTSEDVWNEAVAACSDLVSAYESYGELPGKHGADDLVCKDWKFKARQSVRSLMSKGKAAWEDTEGWETLLSLKEDLSNN